MGTGILSTYYRTSYSCNAKDGAVKTANVKTVGLPYGCLLYEMSVSIVRHSVGSVCHRSNREVPTHDGVLGCLYYNKTYYVRIFQAVFLSLRLCLSAIRLVILHLINKDKFNVCYLEWFFKDFL